MTQFDYVIVGAGPAGCVLANRLSADRAISVLLLEAGGEDTNPLIAMPRGFAELFGDPATAWHYPTRPFGPSEQIESWVRGKTLGGSSSVNGMIYNRGHAGDYDALERLGNPGWGWDDMLPVFRTIEDNPLGASATRGAGGPLRVSTVDGTDPLLEDVITAGTKRGWRRTLDLNDSDEERIGYAMATIRDGRRVNAATAFLHPVIDRPNLTVGLHTLVDQVLLEDGRAVGVRGRRGGHSVEAQAAAPRPATGPRGDEPARRGRLRPADHDLRQPQRTGIRAGLEGCRLHRRGRLTATGRESGLPRAAAVRHGRKPDVSPAHCRVTGA